LRGAERRLAARPHQSHSIPLARRVDPIETTRPPANLRSLSLRADDGQGLVEYGLILSLVMVAAVAVLGVLGVDVDGVFEVVQEAVDDAIGP
jgi:Flp pilus assembly pilin Flp